MDFDHNHYVPCLRWKQGEYQAVLRLRPTTKSALTPLIDISEIGWDFATRSDAKSLDEHLERFAYRLHIKWGIHPCFVDGRLFLQLAPWRQDYMRCVPCLMIFVCKDARPSL